MVYASKLFPCEAEERAFRAEIEQMLRKGCASEALAAVDAKLREIVEHPLAELALAAEPSRVSVRGWEVLSETIESLDLHGDPITAVAIHTSEPSGPDEGASASPRLEPVLETNFYCDEVFPFSGSDRDATNAAFDRAPWKDRFEHRDHSLRIAGVGAPNGANPEAGPLIDSGDMPEPVDRDARQLTAIRTTVLLFMAVARAVEKQGLPRPMTVMIGSDDEFCRLSAPVVTRDEYEAATDDSGEAGDIDESLFKSLASVAPPRQNADYRFTPETEHISGRSLRHRLVGELSEIAEEVAEAVVAEEATVRTGLLGRLFRRSA